jgi:hypothetical protein
MLTSKGEVKVRHKEGNVVLTISMPSFLQGMAEDTKVNLSPRKARDIAIKLLCFANQADDEMPKL